MNKQNEVSVVNKNITKQEQDQELQNNEIIIRGDRYPLNKERFQRLLNKVNEGRSVPTARYDDILDYFLDEVNLAMIGALKDKTEDKEPFVKRVYNIEMEISPRKKSFHEWLISEAAAYNA